MTVWVDADSCHADARKRLLALAVRHQVPVTYVANRTIPFSRESDLFTMLVCPDGKDAADTLILDHAAPGDIVITRDIPFAQRLLGTQVTVLNDRGILLTAEKTAYLLEQRELSLQMASLGIRPAKMRHTYTEADAHTFAATMETLLQSRRASLP